MDAHVRECLECVLSTQSKEGRNDGPCGETLDQLLAENMVVYLKGFKKPLRYMLHMTWSQNDQCE